jgi:methionyl-tRNA formyltransferase
MVDRPGRRVLRVLFAGNPAIALPSLRALADVCLSGGPFLLSGVLTNPDRPRGRSGKPEPTETAAAAEMYRAAFAEKALPPIVILKPETLNADAREAAAALKPDLLVSFAYGRIFGPRFMALFPLGGINVHPSLLPKYRGASPIQEAILRRDALTGICVQKIAPEMDTGNILARKEIPLDGRETAETLGARAAEAGVALLMETLERTAEAGAVPWGAPQEGEASYCSLIEKDSGGIDWNLSAEDIDARIRAYTPWPLAHTGHNGETLYILEAAPYTGPAPEPAGSGTRARAGSILCADKKNGILVQTGGGILALRRLQYRARKALPWQVFLNGARDFTGARLGWEDERKDAVQKFYF